MLDLKRLLVAGVAAGVSLVVASTAFAQSTLETVKKRGHIICGVNVGLGGFSLPDSQGKWAGLDVDMCNAVAAAVLGCGRRNWGANGSVWAGREPRREGAWR